MYSESAGPWSSPSAISIATPGSGQRGPWDHRLAGWDDYQGLAPNPLVGSFLNAWGGDAREVPDAGIPNGSPDGSVPGVWSVILN